MLPLSIFYFFNPTYFVIVVQSLSCVHLFVIHGLQHARLSCPSLSPRVCSKSCPLSQWCYPTVSSSVTLFSFCLPSFPESGSFSMIQLFASGGQNTGASVSALVLLMNIRVHFLQNWLVSSPWSPRDSQEYSPAPQFESIYSSTFILLYGVTLRSQVNW